jgi:UDP-N-acetylmuramyl pentapeptide phosphotransferase/UDP-N-acetylglucosamine-1-phosphate transferase
VAVNQTLRYAVLVGVGFGLAICAIVLMPARLQRRLSVTNHHGRPVPATLGIAIAAASIGAQLVAGVVALFVGTELGRDTWALLGGSTLVFATGLFDDHRPGGPRGLRAHGRELVRRGRVTTGLVKAAAGVGGAVLVVLTVHGREPWVMAAGVILIAGTANVWNGLDVAPGRAGKLFLLGAIPLLFLSPPALLARLLGAEAAALWPDLRERGMLGDSGSNLMGFVLGAALYGVLAPLGVAIAAGVVVALNLLAETVTLSRIVNGVPPLKWLDRAGRVREEEVEAASPPAPPSEPEQEPEPAGQR